MEQKTITVLAIYGVSMALIIGYSMVGRYKEAFQDNLQSIIIGWSGLILVPGLLYVLLG